MARRTPEPQGRSPRQTLTMPPDWWEALGELAVEMNTTRSELIYRLVEQLLRQHGKLEDPAPLIKAG